MGNIFTAIGHGVKTGVVDTGKGIKSAVDFAIVHPVEFVFKAEKVLNSAIKDQPVVKSEVLALVTRANTVIKDIAEDAEEKGVDLNQDLQTLKDAEAFFQYFKDTFIPSIESVYAEVSADIK